MTIATATMETAVAMSKSEFPSKSEVGKALLTNRNLDAWLLRQGGNTPGHASSRLVSHSIGALEGARNAGDAEEGSRFTHRTVCSRRGDLEQFTFVFRPLQARVRRRRISPIPDSEKIAATNRARLVGSGMAGSMPTLKL